MRRMLLLATAVVATMALTSPAFAAPSGSSTDGAQVRHECFEDADLCQHQVLTPSGHNSGYSFFTPSEPVGTPPESAEVTQECFEEPGMPPERVCSHSTRTPSGNILSSFNSKTLE
jgi:hypothetical protein